MNKFLCIGRLVADPEKKSKGETVLAKFRVAVDRKTASKEKTADFFNCTAFGKTAEFAEKYLKKGTKVAIVGRVQIEDYTNKEGQKASSTEVIVEELEFAESKKDNGMAPQQAPQVQQPQVQPPQPPQYAPQYAQAPAYGQPQAPQYAQAPVYGQQAPQGMMPQTGQPPVYVGANDPGFIPAAPTFQ